jgi:hypothetical protein
MVAYECQTTTRNTQTVTPTTLTQDILHLKKKKNGLKPMLMQCATNKQK